MQERRRIQQTTWTLNGLLVFNETLDVQLDRLIHAPFGFLRACFAHMWDDALLAAYRRKYHDRTVDHIRSALEESLAWPLYRGGLIQPICSEIKMSRGNVAQTRFQARTHENAKDFERLGQGWRREWDSLKRFEKRGQKRAFSGNSYRQSNLASSHFFGCFRLFTPVFGRCRHNDTPNVTRRNRSLVYALPSCPVRGQAPQQDRAGGPVSMRRQW